MAADVIRNPGGSQRWGGGSRRGWPAARRRWPAPRTTRTTPTPPRTGDASWGRPRAPRGRVAGAAAFFRPALLRDAMRRVWPARPAGPREGRGDATAPCRPPRYPRNRRRWAERSPPTAPGDAEPGAVWPGVFSAQV